MIATSINRTNQADITEDKLTVATSAPVAATPAMLGIIAVAAIVCVGAGAAGAAAGR